MGITAAGAMVTLPITLSRTYRSRLTVTISATLPVRGSGGREKVPTFVTLTEGREYISGYELHRWCIISWGTIYMYSEEKSWYDAGMRFVNGIKDSKPDLRLQVHRLRLQA